MHQAFLVIAMLSLSCLWDSDTLRDEARLRPDVWEVISGQFARHSEAYYRSRVAAISALPTPDRVQRNDLAVACIRLKDLAWAEKVLTALRAEDAQEYEALSNFAVLRRNQGRFAEAVPLFEQALKLRPEGHLGLGDWTLRAVRWQARVVEDPTLAEREDFLGRPRAAEVDMFLTGKEVTSVAWDKLPADTQEHLRLLNLLLRNYTVFAEGFLTLGDELAAVDDNSLAIYAYVRALDLQHPATALLRQRIRAVATRVGRWSGPLHSIDDHGIERTVDEILAGARGELAKCTRWQDDFTRLEGVPVAAGKQPSFEETLAACTAKGITPYLPTTDVDRRAEVSSMWVDGLDLLKRRQFPAAEQILAKASTLAEKTMPDSGDRARLLIVYAASLSPQGGAAHLRMAAKALEEAERIFRGEADRDRASLDMTLGNLVLVYGALKDQKQVAAVTARLQALVQEPAKP